MSVSIVRISELSEFCSHTTFDFKDFFRNNRGGCEC